jgi:hypothetical protein
MLLPNVISMPSKQTFCCTYWPKWKFSWRTFVVSKSGGNGPIKKGWIVHAQHKMFGSFYKIWKNFSL